LSEIGISKGVFRRAKSGELPSKISTSSDCVEFVEAVNRGFAFISIAGLMTSTLSVFFQGLSPESE
jgi:hypothetical protein